MFRRILGWAATAAGFVGRLFGGFLRRVGEAVSNLGRRIEQVSEQLQETVIIYDMPDAPLDMDKWSELTQLKGSPRQKEKYQYVYEAIFWDTFRLETVSWVLTYSSREEAEWSLIAEKLTPMLGEYGEMQGLKLIGFRPIGVRVRQGE